MELATFWLLELKIIWQPCNHSLLRAVLPDWATSRQLGYFHIDLAPKNVGWRLATFWATFNLKLGYKFIFGLCSFLLQIVLD